MKLRINASIITGILFCLIAATSSLVAQTFTHPGVRHSRGDLDLMKSRILANQQPWKGAYDNMIAWQGYGDGKLGRTPSSLNFAPAPRTTIDVGYYEKPHIGFDEALTDATAAYIHAIQWYITGNSAHAEKVMAICKAWGTSLTSISGDNAKLATAWITSMFCDAAEIVRTTYSGPQDWTAFDNMLRTKFYTTMYDFAPSGFNGNWDALMSQAMMSMGVVLNDRAIYDRGKNYYLSGKGNGSLPNYCFTDGTTQETTRDQRHEQMGVLALANSAEIAWKQGEDLYSALGNRLLIGLEGTAGRVDAQNFGAYPGWDIPYNHYHNRKHLATPTMDLFKKTTEWGGDNWSYNTVGFWTAMTFRDLGDPNPNPVTPPVPVPTPIPDTRTNLALNKTTTASSSDTNIAANAVDGNLETRWSADAYPQWIRVDLGSVALLNKTEMVPYLNRAYTYKVETSLDGTTFTQVVDRADNTTESAFFADSFAPVSARYVRLTVTGCSGSYTGTWSSIAELRVFGLHATSVMPPIFSLTPSVDAHVKGEPGAGVKYYNVQGRMVYRWQRDGNTGRVLIRVPGNVSRYPGILNMILN